MLLKRSPSGSVGFTLIEVVAVLIILGILTAVAVGRSMDSGAELVSQTDVIKSHLRYAQSRAMAMEEVWGIRSTGSGYYLFRVDTTNKITLPGEESDVISLADKGIDSMTVGTFSFDDEGNRWQMMDQKLYWIVQSSLMEKTPLPLLFLRDIFPDIGRRNLSTSQLMLLVYYE